MAETVSSSVNEMCMGLHFNTARISFNGESLEEALNSKADYNHKHTLFDIDGVIDTIPNGLQEMRHLGLVKTTEQVEVGTPLYMNASTIFVQQEGIAPLPVLTSVFSTGSHFVGAVSEINATYNDERTSGDYSYIRFSTHGFIEIDIPNISGVSVGSKLTLNGEEIGLIFAIYTESVLVLR